jgi:4-alpha-glucanotransferase
MNAPRGSGVLLHPTSLPGGRLGADAYRFVDWLADAGQSWWQVLPLGPPDRSRSPYNCMSAFASSRALVAASRSRVSRAELDAFRERQAFWVGDYARRGLLAKAKVRAIERARDLVLRRHPVIAREAERLLAGM